MTDPIDIIEPFFAKINDARRGSVSSEFKHILDFVEAQVDNVIYDFRNGAYTPDDSPEDVLRQRIQGCLDELVEAAKAISARLYHQSPG